MGKAIYNKKRAFFTCQNWILSLFCFSIIFVGCKEKEEIRILFTGDILLSRNVAVEIDKRKVSPWEALSKTFRSVDLIIGNLEGAVGSGKSTNLEGESPTFPINPEKVKLLSSAGFKALSIENNHSFDNGEDGKVNTFNKLVSEGIAPIQFDNSPQFFQVKNISIAMIGVNLIPDRENSQQKIPSVELLQKLRLAKNLSNVVVVFIHWGSELLEWPNQTQREAAKWLTENGADLIIGSHPHVIQKAELVNGKPVFFSLGNHLFDQKYVQTKQGLTVDFLIKDGYFSCKGILTHTAEHSFFPIIKGEENYDFPKMKLHEPIVVSNLSLKGISETDGKIKLTAMSDQNIAWKTVPKNIVSISSSKLDGEHEFLLSLEKHYSNMDHSVEVRPYVYSVTQKSLLAQWRGSALAWPLIDATFLPNNQKILCGLHKGNSFINLNSKSDTQRVLAYKWNGFGFSGLQDSTICKECEEYYREFSKSKSAQ